MLLKTLSHSLFNNILSHSVNKCKIQSLTHKIIILLFLIFTQGVYSCNTNGVSKNFIEKLDSNEIKSIRIYRICNSLIVKTGFDLLDNVCNYIINISPQRLIVDPNKVDSIYLKQEIFYYKNFLLKYDKQYQNEIRLQNNLDIRVGLLIEFDDRSIDTLSFITNKKIQVNEETVLGYSTDIKNIFQNKYQ